MVGRDWSSRIAPVLLASLMMLLLSGSARAQTDPACTGNLSVFAYNGFFVGNFNAQNSDVQGRLAAGGAVTLNNYGVADRLTDIGAGNSLIVGGNLTFPSGRLFFGNALVAGTANVGQPVRAGLGRGQTITDHAVLPLDFAATQAQIDRLSQLLIQLAVNGTYQSRFGGLYLKGAPSGAMQVFDLPGDLVLSSHTFDVQAIPSGATVVFNIRGNNAGFRNVGLATLASLRQRVVFNFPEATTLTLANVGIEGSVIAPKAAITNPQGNINGSVFANSWSGPMELHHYPFAGCLKVNQPPIAIGQVLTTVEDTPLAIVLTGSDPDKNPLSYAVLTQPSHGVLSGTPPKLVYTPAAEYNGPDAFTFRVNDGKENSTAATIQISVTRVNDAPTANPQNLTTPEDTPLPVELTGADIERTELGFHIAAGPQHGTLSGVGARIVYTPVADYFGEDQFTFVSDDGEAYSTPATIRIAVTPVNDAPTAHAQELEVSSNTSLPILLTGTDPEGDVLSFETAGGPSHGVLSGHAPNLVYTPARDYRGPDQFEFVVSDGALFSASALVAITVTRTNGAPVIVSTAVETGSEAEGYQYDVDAQDPDGDVLHYTYVPGPTALSIDPNTGFLSGSLDPELVQPVRAFNKQCYVIPDGATLENGEGTLIAPLYLRVRSAISKASTYVAPQTLSWDRTNGCIGCHVQNQALIGLQGSMERAEVDEQAAEYLLAKILDSIQPDGSIRRSHPEFSLTQTAFALWALSYVPDRARTLAVREQALRFFGARVQASGKSSFWTRDHDSGWLISFPQSPTAIVALAAARYLQDISRLPGVTPSQVQLGQDLRALLPRLAEYLLSISPTGNDNLVLALGMTGLGELASQITDASLHVRIAARLAELDTTLRARERPGGGWHMNSATTADPLVSAWVGFALDELDPPLTDPVVLRNIEFLLASQRADGTWPTNSGLFTTFLGTTGLVMAYLPIALEHLGNPDLTVGGLHLEQTSNGWLLSGEAINRGLTDVEVTSTLRFVSGRALDGAPLGVATVPPLRSGESYWASIALAADPPGEVAATIAADEAIDECIVDNNFSRARLIRVRATDPFGLSATQTFLANLRDSNSPPQITSQALPELEQGLAYGYRVAARDVDVGDAQEFELDKAPPGLFINSLNGQIDYDSRELAVGTHDVTVKVTDLRGASATQSYRLTVIANHAPSISSTPGTSVRLGETYGYDVDAADPDGDALEYRLDGAPLTMTIDSATGLIRFTPERRHVGNQPVAVIADDRRGGTARQNFTLVVSEPAPNQLPQITSSPALTAEVGVEYAYVLVANDPDGDSLSYTLSDAPAGMRIDPATGSIHWTPAASQVGRHQVVIRVEDARGLSNLQVYTLTVAARDPAAVDGDGDGFAVNQGDCDDTNPAINPAALDVPDDGIDQDCSGADSHGAIDVDDDHDGLSENQGDCNDANAAVHPGAMDVPGNGIDEDCSGSDAAVARADIEPPLVDVQGATVNAGESATISVRATDAGGIASLTLTVNGAPVALGMDGRAVLATSQPGVLALVATATDTSGNSATDSDFVYVHGPNDGIPPVVQLTSPAVGDELVSPTNIIGTASDGALARWELSIVPVSPAGSAPITLSSGTGNVAGGVLGVFDPSVLGAGEYLLRLTAYDLGGQAAEIERVVTSVNAAKYGLFSLTFSDAVIPLPSFPISVQRTYYSGDRARDGDFGFGWRLGFRSTRIEVDNLPGRAWTRENRGSFLPNWVLIPTEPHTVSIIDDDDNSIIFDFTPSFDNPVFDATFATGDWSERTKTGAVLEALGGSGLVFSGDELLSDDSFEPYDPSGYVLTLPDGREYFFSKEDGLTDYRDSNGNTLHISSSGISSSRGVGVTFTRDANGHVTSIRQPSGGTTTYAYDSAGNLTTVSDPENHRTTYAYDRNHYLTGIVDPMGKVPMRNEYDEQGRLIALVDSRGNRTEFTSDPDLRRQTVTDRLGNLTTYSYDARGRVVEKHLPDQSTRRFSYDADGNKTSESDGLGRTKTWIFDTQHHATSYTDTLGNHTTYAHDARGNLLQIVDALGRSKTIEYDANNNPTTATFPDGTTRTYSYDAQGNLQTETDPAGGVTTHTYDSQGRETRKVAPDGGATTYDYDADGRKIREVAPDGAIEDYTYDRVGSMLERATLGAKTSLQYDAVGRHVRQTNPLGGVRAFAYDDYGRLSAETDASGKTTAFVYDAEGRLSERTESDGRRTTFAYDPMGRVVQTAENGVAIESRAYDAAGQLIEVANALGESTVFSYDAGGREQTITFPDGSVESKTYDAAGNVIARSTALGLTTFTYDAMDRLTSMTDPEGGLTSYTLDVLGRVESVVAPNGSSSAYDYDAAGRVARVTDSLGNSSLYAYDTAGRRVSFLDPTGRSTTYTYDQRGFPTARTVGGTVLERYTSNAMGWLTERTSPAGDVTRYEYDPTGRVTRIVYPDSTNVGLTYDLAGRRATVADTRGVTQYTYDASGRLAGVAQPGGIAVGYQYDDAGKLNALTSPAGVTSYERDERGRITAVVDPAGGRYVYARDSAGFPVSVTYPNGIEVQTAYDGNGFPRERTILARDHSVLARFTITRDAAGHAQEVAESGGALSGTLKRAYAYDAGSRLTRATSTRSGVIEDDRAYTLDSFGNRTRVVDNGVARANTFDTLGRITSDGVRSYTHDSNGNLTRADGPSGTTTYTYDYEQRLRQVLLPGSMQPITYQYDMDGNRVSRGQGGNSIRYVLDVSDSLPDVVAEVDGSGTVQASYTYADGELLGMLRAGKTSYVIADPFGNVRLLTNAAGAVTDTFEYDAFGNPLGRTGTTDLPYRFGSQRWDSDTGLYYLRARYYDPATGRFLTSDLATGDALRPVTFNRYLYAVADPINSADPSGLQDSLAGAMAGVSMSSTLSSIALPSFTALLSSVKVQLFVAGVVTVGGAIAITNSPTAMRQLEEEWEKLKKAIIAASLAATCGVPLFHYTDQFGATSILATQEMFATSTYRGPVFTYPSGAYASTIWPVGPMTQSMLSQHFYGGDRNRNVGWYAMLCSNLNPFTPVGSPTHPDFWYSPAPAGFPVPVRTYTIGPNLMLP